MICPNCGNACSETAKFCSVCGTQFAAEVKDDFAAAPVGDAEKQQSVLNTMYRFLKYRRLACKISGVVLLILSLFFIIFGGLFAGLGITSLVNEYSYGFGGFGVGYGTTWFVMGILYLPIAIVNLAMANKAEKFMNELYFNVRPAANYLGSVGQLVLCYFFNEIALVFAIIGLVNVKTKSEIINQIEQNQKL